MTSQVTFQLNAELRDGQGKGASRRLRRLEDRIPAILYGGNKAPASITLDHKKVMHALEHQAFYSHLLTLDFGKSKEQVILKDVQRHHFKKAILHMDFQRVKSTDKINMRVPLRFTNEEDCPGVKAGGIVSHRIIDVEIRCVASALPEFIEVDLAEAVLDQIVHLSDLKLPKGAEIVSLSHSQGSEHDHAVVSIHLPRRAEEKETPASTAADDSKDATAAAADKGK